MRVHDSYVGLVQCNWLLSVAINVCVNWLKVLLLLIPTEQELSTFTDMFITVRQWSQYIITILLQTR